MAPTAIEARYAVAVPSGEVAAYVGHIEAKGATHFWNQELDVDGITAFPGVTAGGRTKLKLDALRGQGIFTQQGFEATKAETLART